MSTGTLFDDSSEDHRGDWAYGEPVRPSTPPDAWIWMTRIEPRLLELERRLLQARRVANYWPAWAEASRVLKTLVGWTAQDPRLRRQRLYEAAQMHLLTVHEDHQEGIR